VFWTLSIVRYSKENNVSEAGSVSVLRWGGTPTLLGPVERTHIKPYAPAARFPHEDSWYSFQFGAESTPGPTVRLEGLGQEHYTKNCRQDNRPPVEPRTYRIYYGGTSVWRAASISCDSVTHGSLSPPAAAGRCPWRFFACVSPFCGGEVPLSFRQYPLHTITAYVTEQRLVLSLFLLLLGGARGDTVGQILRLVSWICAGEVPLEQLSFCPAISPPYNNGLRHRTPPSSSLPLPASALVLHDDANNFFIAHPQEAIGRGLFFYLDSYTFWEYNAVYSVANQTMFLRNMSPPSSRRNKTV
jgi:hypothetical protein